MKISRRQFLMGALSTVVVGVGVREAASLGSTYIFEPHIGPAVPLTKNAAEDLMAEMRDAMESAFFYGRHNPTVYVNRDALSEDVRHESHLLGVPVVHAECVDVDGVNANDDIAAWLETM